MCGFAGLYAVKSQKSRPELHTLARKMTETLDHRGPDSGGLWQDPDTFLVLGHRRLAIIDLSAEGHQPMASASERYVIVYNGEIYNYADLARELKIAGAQFHGRSDTEVLLAAIEHWGLNLALQKINGMFAFALWDRKERTLHFVRDRFGKKPLYVGWAGGTLVFGSELKALCAHPEFKKDISLETLALYLRYGYIPAPHCIYQKTWSLTPGSRLSLNLNNLESGSELSSKIERYWHPLQVAESMKHNPVTGSDHEIITEFEDVLTQCVRDRLMSDVPLGAFLSGGIDSSAVVALMQKQSSRPVKTYTIGFEEDGYDEAEHGAKIAAHLGTDHQELYLSAKDTLHLIPNLPEIYDEPFADISAIPTYLVSTFARQDVTVALSGDGGDEMLGGYNRHITAPALNSRMQKIPAPLRKMMGGLMSALPVGTWDALMPAKPQFGTHVHKAAGIMNLDAQEDIYQKLISLSEAYPALTLPEIPDSFSFAEKMMLWDTLYYLPSSILVKVDRASMAVGLEARAPLLDTRVFEYAWRLPENLKIRKGQGKIILREILARHVPREMFERPKQGFSMPVGDWVRGPLKDWAEDLLSEQALDKDGLLDTKTIRAYWQAHLNHQGHHTQFLWAVLMFQAWRQRWI